MNLNHRTKLLTRSLQVAYLLSGFSALVYEVAWHRILTLYYGVSSVSITLIVSIYMCGLGGGALLEGLLVRWYRNKVLLYIAIELFIGLFGALSPYFLTYFGELTAGADYIYSAILIWLLLVIPTLLMGATLPLITTIFHSLYGEYFSNLSFLYFLNNIGASFGAFASAYLIISFFGIANATFVAAFINFGLACLVFVFRPRQNLIGNSLREPPTLPPLARKRLLIALLVGFLSMGFQITMLRLIATLVKDSPYGFPSALSVYLLGIAAGSLLAWRLFRARSISLNQRLPRIQFYFGIYALISILAYYYLTKYTGLDIFTRLSFWNTLHPNLIIPKTRAEWFMAFDIFAWPFFFLFVPALCAGVSFPLLCSASSPEDNQIDANLGNLYASNIAGNVLGVLITGFVLLPYLKTETTLLIFTLAGLVFGFIAQPASFGRYPFLRASTALLLLFAVCFFPRNGELYRIIHAPPGPSYLTFVEEGIHGVVVAHQNGEVVRNFINGTGHGGRPNPQSTYQAIEALSFAPNLDSILVIGFGTGSTVETALKHDDLNRLSLVEINGTLLKNLHKISPIRRIFDNEKLNVTIDDGRRFLYRNEERFSAILMDPLGTKNAYANNLFSQEFFSLAKTRLRTNGIILVWTDEERILPLTIASVFPYVRLYKHFLIASAEPMKRVMRTRTRLFASLPLHERTQVLESEKRYPYLGDRSKILELAGDTSINRDLSPQTEYYLGLEIRKSFNRTLRDRIARR